MERPEWADEVQQKFNELELLQPGWDGHDAPEIHPMAIAHASNLVEFFAYAASTAPEYQDNFQPDVSPMITGGVLLFIPSGPVKSDGENDGIKIELGSNGIKFFEYVTKNGNTIPDRLLFEKHLVEAFVGLLIGD